MSHVQQVQRAKVEDGKIVLAKHAQLLACALIGLAAYHPKQGRSLPAVQLQI